MEMLDLGKSYLHSVVCDTSIQVHIKAVRNTNCLLNPIMGIENVSS